MLKTSDTKYDVHAFLFHPSQFFNPTFTKPFGTHTLYQGEGGVRPDPLLYQKPLPS